MVKDRCNLCEKEYSEIFKLSEESILGIFREDVKNLSLSYMTKLRYYSENSVFGLYSIEKSTSMKPEDVLTSMEFLSENGIFEKHEKNTGTAYFLTDRGVGYIDCLRSNKTIIDGRKRSDRTREEAKMYA